jgi:uroporphyrinogen-III synthase
MTPLSMVPLIVIRPQPGADATVAAARDFGLEAQAFPLFTVEAVVWKAPEPSDIDALLIGSANALRHAGPALASFRDKPAYAVGQATAAACRAAGLIVAVTGSGGLDRVLADIPGSTSVLRLAGRERVALSAPPGVRMTERIVYASNPLPIPPALAELLHSPAVVMLHSATAANHFAAECDRLGLDRIRISLATIGPRVTTACGSGWAVIATAATPDDAALLAQARQLCQNRGGTLMGGAV